MATILSSKKSSVGSPYAYYTVAATTSSRTPLSALVTVKITTKLADRISFFGTGKGLQAGLYVGGSWHTVTVKSTSSSWSGTSAHTAEMSFRVSGLSASTSALTGIKFRVLRTDSTGSACKLNETSCSNIAVTKISSKYENVAITVDENNMTQAKAKVILSGLPKSVGFATKIYWYLNGTYKTYTSISSTATATSYSYTFTGLKPNTAYTFKAVVYYGTDSLTSLKSKSVAETTPQETGTLKLTPKATYITAAVSGMFNSPNYTRSIEIYYKKDEESDYKLFSTETTQGVDMSKNITGLISNSVYDIKVLVKNGTTTLLTLTDRIETLEDTSLIPTAMIEQITQQLGTRLCTLEWVPSKPVGGTMYVVEAKSENGTEWQEFASMSEVISPVTIELTPEDMGNANVNFRIKSTNVSVAEGTINYSEVVTFYVRDDFLWDSDKVAGQPLIITANEWNRLREYAVARNEDLGIVVDIPTVSPDDEISASTYNVMKNAISNVTAIDISDKKRGDVIAAADIDVLRVAINTVA